METWQIKVLNNLINLKLHIILLVKSYETLIKFCKILEFVVLVLNVFLIDSKYEIHTFKLWFSCKKIKVCTTIRSFLHFNDGDRYIPIIYR